MTGIQLSDQIRPPGKKIYNKKTISKRWVSVHKYLVDAPAPYVLAVPAPDVEFLHDVLRRLTTPDEVDAPPPPPASSAESAPEL